MAAIVAGEDMGSSRAMVGRRNGQHGGWDFLGGGSSGGHADGLKDRFGDIWAVILGVEGD